jgi:hypothetical protein
MTYLKPVLTVVGEAPALVLGHPVGASDGGNTFDTQPGSMALGLDD